MSLQNILVPIDFSENALNGLKVACEIGSKFKAKLHLMSAFHIPAPLTDIGGAPQMIESFITDYREEVQDSMSDLETLVPALNNVTHEKDVYLANTIDAIYSAIESKSIDPVVMGTRSTHTGIEHMLGGVSTDVIRHAQCPVLVIPEQVHQFEPKKIALAIDYKSTEELGKLGTINEFCKAYDASLSIVHVAAPDQIKTKDQMLKKIELTQLFQDTVFSFEIIQDKNVREGLNKYLDDTRQNLLVMMPRRHDLFASIFKRSLTKKVALDMHIPLLTIHE